MESKERERRDAKYNAKKLSKKNRKKRKMRFRVSTFVLVYNYYTLIIFVFLSNINRLNANAKCITPLSLLYN